MALRILTVCTANVCRSPMAAAFIQHHLETNGVGALVTSAGTRGGNVLVDPNAVKAMKERGFDITLHIPRLLDQSMIIDDGADLVIAMTRAHVQTVAVTGSGVFQRAFTAKELARRTHRAMSTPALHKRTFAAWRDAVCEGRLARDLIRDDPADDISDPYGRPLAEHRRTADDLDSLMAVIARSIAEWMSS